MGTQSKHESDGEMLNRDIILEANGLCKSFDEHVVLNHVSLSLRAGEILGIIGPSGEGKSTLLRCLNGLTSLEAGTIHYHNKLKIVAGNDGSVRYYRPGRNTSEVEVGASALSSLRQYVGFVSQNLNLWEERTILQNLCLAPQVVHKRSKQEVTESARQLCERYGLTAKLRTKVWQLSGGQRQRVALVRALMMNPSILLLDEVTSSLDPMLTASIMSSIRQLRDDGLTLVLVTHHLEFAASLCDRILFVAKGQCIPANEEASIGQGEVGMELARYLEILRIAR